MSTIKERVLKEFEDLKTARDEIRVKAHLARADLKDQLDRIEARWPEVEDAAREVERLGNQAGETIAKTARDLFTEIRAAYERLRAEKPGARPN
jgi:predicted  nucleic acid-binding Zn-ribbon protein